MNLIVKTPKEIDYVVDAPFIWNPFMPKYVKPVLHEYPVSWTYSNWTEKDYDVISYKNAPSVYGNNRSSSPFR